MKKILLIDMSLLSLCGYAQIAVESFEGTFPPEGWGVYDNGTGTEQWEQSPQGSVTLPAYTGEHAAHLASNDVTTGTPQDWLITPQFKLANNPVIRFYSRLTQPFDQGTTYELRIKSVGEQGDFTNYVLIQSWTEMEMNPVQDQYTEHIVNLPVAFTGQQVYVAFVMIGDGGDSWLIDDVSITSACIPPTNLFANDITDNSATLGWSGGDTTEWEIVVLPAEAPFQGTGGVISTVNPYTVTGLVPENYKFYVRSLCPGGGTSEWAGPHYFSTIGQTGNTVTGYVRYDVNGDLMCGGDETAIPGIEIEVIINDGEPYTVYTNDMGQYTLYNLPDGANTVTLEVTPPVGFNGGPVVTQTIEFTEEDTQANINLCLPQPDAVSDLSIVFVPTNAARPGFPAYYQAIVTNHGTTTIGPLTATLTFNDVKTDFVNANVAHTAGTGTVTLDLSAIAPFASQTVNMEFYVLPPDENIGGEILEFTATLSAVQDEITPDDNTALLNQIVVNSFDPNDITVHEGAYITPEQTGNYLTYTIRFQNTGTADAVNIRLENTLEEGLDWDTFQPIASSHTYTVTRTGGELEFRYDNIHLPDEDTNEPGSHGFVTYRIKPNADFSLGDIVYNTAGIFFDFNPAIVTNTVSTEVAELAGTNDNTINRPVVYPNPVKDRLNISTLSAIEWVQLFDLNGRLCLSSQNSEINTQSLTRGIYLMKITTESGTSTFKVIKE